MLDLIIKGRPISLRCFAQCLPLVSAPNPNIDQQTGGDAIWNYMYVEHSFYL